VVREVVDELQPKFGGGIVTEVDLVKLYNVAEEYHQGYLEKVGHE
jgi:peptide methionine sulfoxide reductase MsrA